MRPVASTHVDVLIVGAGLSGIGAACALQMDAPGRSWGIVEARDTSGGTWDLFRFPGIRSDSDMSTLGYRFHPWNQDQTIAGGADILAYLREAARAYGVDRRIEYGWRVRRADFSCDSQRWTVTMEHPGSGEQRIRTCGFLYVCTGYFRYDRGYTPDWPGREQFTGRLVHPQFWPTDLDVDGCAVVVVGSGATAVTLVPALVAAGARVTMLQRSPSYVMSLSTRDPIGRMLKRMLPERMALDAIRWKNIRLSTAVYQLCQRYPTAARKLLLAGVRRRLPNDFDVDRHFSPSYGPWDQRLCLVPDGDFFRAIASGRADVVTDHIVSFTADGLRLRSGGSVKADIIVTATGLELLPLGEIELSIDAERVDIAERVAYKGTMLDGVPNLAFALGYTNASWALKVELSTSYLMRLLNLMERNAYGVATPTLPPGPMPTTAYIDMASGYFERLRGSLPRQGQAIPWRIHQHYARDAKLLGEAVDQPEMVFTPRSADVGRSEV